MRLPPRRERGAGAVPGREEAAALMLSSQGQDAEQQAKGQGQDQHGGAQGQEQQRGGGGEELRRAAADGEGGVAEMEVGGAAVLQRGGHHPLQGLAGRETHQEARQAAGEGGEEGAEDIVAEDVPPGHTQALHGEGHALLAEDEEVGKEQQEGKARRKAHGADDAHRAEHGAKAALRRGVALIVDGDPDPGGEGQTVQIVLGLAVGQAELAHGVGPHGGGQILRDRQEDHVLPVIRPGKKAVHPAGGLGVEAAVCLVALREGEIRAGGGAQGEGVPHREAQGLGGGLGEEAAALRVPIALCQGENIFVEGIEVLGMVAAPEGQGPALHGVGLSHRQIGAVLGQGVAILGGDVLTGGRVREPSGAV